MKLGASICRDTTIENCSYIRLPNLKNANVAAAKKLMEEVQMIDIMFLFLNGNSLFPSKNYRDSKGNLHGHKSQKRRWKNRQVETQMLKYKPLIRLKINKLARSWLSHAIFGISIECVRQLTNGVWLKI